MQLIKDWLHGLATNQRLAAWSAPKKGKQL